MDKDNIAFGAVVGAFLVAAVVALALPARPHLENGLAAVRGAEALAARPAVEIRYLEPITVVGYRDPPVRHPPEAANTDVRRLLYRAGLAAAEAP